MTENVITNVEFDMLLLVFSDVARKLFVERQRDGKRLALAD
ncbi:MAG: hypothetical protein VB814_03645 [Pirellulaceae bacterium]